MPAIPRRVAVVGAGWAGLAAAVEATRAGHAVTVYEAARTPGGRARRLALQLPDGRECAVDNGQHILIGAYGASLSLMADLGVDVPAAFLRLPLALRTPDGGGLALPDWPSPLDTLAGILTARGWSWADKASLLRAAAGWQLRHFACGPEVSVAALCVGLTDRVRAEMIEPLCVSALNTPAERSSGQVFLRVLKDALFGPGHAGWGASNLLLPRHDLGRLLPDAACAWLAARGVAIAAGRRVTQLQPRGPGWQVDDVPFDAVVLATPPWEAARLVRAAGIDAGGWAARAEALQHEAITTVYALGEVRLPSPMLALRSDAARPAQFVFDRSRLGGPEGLLAFVVSASRGDRAMLERQVVAQAAALGWDVTPLQTVVEKRATFACTPGLVRPGTDIAPGLLACGDYVAGPYPATLEGAVLSAHAAVAVLGAVDRPMPRRNAPGIPGSRPSPG